MDLTKQPDERTPACKKIEADLRHKVETGVWPVGSTLPPRRHLAQSYGVPLATLERAIAPLLAEGMLRANPRQGTVIARGAAATAVARITPGKPVRRIGDSTDSGKTLGIVTGICDPPPVYAEDDWGLAILTSIEKTFAPHGGTYVVNRYLKDKPPLSPREVIQRLLDASVDAIVYVTIEPPIEHVQELLATIAQMGLTDRLPIALVTHAAIRRPLTHVFYDIYGDGYLAAQHLIRCGHEKFVFLRPVETDWIADRLVGVSAALEDAGFNRDALTVHYSEPPCSIIPSSDYERLDVHKRWSRSTNRGFIADNDLAARTLVSRICVEQGFDEGLFDGSGIIAANDLIGKEVIEGALKRGLVPGKDFSVIGFDDHVYSRFIGLSTMRPPLDAMGEAATQLIIQAINGKPATTQVRLGSLLIQRNSTRMPLK
ncbi:MAG: GntR family transcriptional regulator [Capsulimonadaceae bacterium]|nr:GntR family transcriptional regulator [Capsulimonadaceae bacterium]